jgi:hypothetical protein
MYPVLVVPVLRSSDYDKHELQSSRRNSQLRHCRGDREVDTLCIRMAMVILGIPEPRLGTWRSQKQGCYEQVVCPPLALRIGILKGSALPNDGLDAPVSSQCRTPQDTNHKGHWVPKCFVIQLLVLASSMYPALVFLVLRSLDYDKHELQSSRRKSQLRHWRGELSRCTRYAYVCRS